MICTFVCGVTEIGDVYHHLSHRHHLKIHRRIFSVPSTNSVFNEFWVFLIADIRAFFSAAEKTKKCFPSLYTCLDIEDGLDYHLPHSKVESFLNIFGHLIKSIRWSPNRQPAYDSENFQRHRCFLWKKFTLFILYIFSINLNFVQGSRFESLAELILASCFVVDFKMPPNLKKLNLGKRLPNLVDLEFAFIRNGDRMTLRVSMHAHADG